MEDHVAQRPSLSPITRLIDFAITTVVRPVSYIQVLMEGIPPDLPVRLVVGGPDTSHLKQYISAPNVSIVVPQEEQWKKFEQGTVHHRACWNYWRSLVFGPKSPDSTGLVVFEDDIVLTRGWQQRLHETISEIELGIKSSDFVLALYTARALRQLETRLYAPYPTWSFFGTQAMYYPAHIRNEFAKYLWLTGVQTYREPYDLLLREYLHLRAVPLFATIPCLAQHVGQVSTGLGQFHHAYSFGVAL